jgi:hypothetical protein
MGILEQILQELNEINMKLSLISQQKSDNDNTSRTADNLSDAVTVDDIKAYLHIGITRAYAIINLPEFTRMSLGQKTCIPKEQFVDWVEKERKKREMGIKSKFTIK